MGAMVEARCKGSKKYYRGIVFKDNRDGTYDVKFDDGDRDRAVPEGFIKPVGSGGKPASRTASRTSEDRLSEGDKVEARCKGSKKHYPGKIFMDNRDGTFDVKFVDGDRDREVPKSSIKKLGGRSVPEERPISGSGTRSSVAQAQTKLSVGTPVEARYQGRTKYYPGKILRARISGKYDIAYDDGESEMQVGRDMIRVLGHATVGDGSALSEGDNVQARCKGSKKHYPGKIFMDNRDGTYDVKFDDGDRDREVPKSSRSSAATTCAMLAAKRS